MMKTVRSG